MKWLNKKIKWLNERMNQLNKKNQSRVGDVKKSKPKDVYSRAKTWTDDHYSALVAGRKRYQIAFFVTMQLCCLLTLAVIILAPMQQITPLLVNHYPDGRVSVVPFNQNAAPIHTPLVKSDIVRYIMNRESYDAIAYDEQYKLVSLLSNNAVDKAYEDSQSTNNKNSPVNLLGADGIRRVHIDSVVFLDRESLNQPGTLNDHHVNLAQVDFTVNTIQSGIVKKTTPFTALISWAYLGTPTSPYDMWRNPYGFTVTRYDINQRNI